MDFFGASDLMEGFAEQAAARVARERHADGLGDERHRAECTDDATAYGRSRTYMCGRAIF